MCFPPGIVNNIPHFGLAHRIMTLLCQFIIRMHLYREVVTSINEFDQQGKIIAKTLIITFSYQRTFIFFYQLAQIFAGFSSISNNRLIARDIRNFPTFANLRLFNIQMFERNNLFSTPMVDFRIGLNLNGYIGVLINSF